MRPKFQVNNRSTKSTKVRTDQGSASLKPLSCPRSIVVSIHAGVASEQVLHNPKFVTLGVVEGVEGWDTLEERPTGSREKVTVSSTDTGQLMIFKHPKELREHQIWSELIASYIAGDLLGWDVQIAGLGLRNGKAGNLLHYIFNPDAGEQLVEGWQLCIEVEPTYDIDKGTRHSLTLLAKVASDVLLPRYQVTTDQFFDFWARALALDALISNTDRHAENWGIIVGPAGNRMAPLYDNATSLGCGIDTKGLEKFFDNKGEIVVEQLKRFAAKGCHHLRLDSAEKRGARFEDVIHAFLGHHPEKLAHFQSVADLDLTKVLPLLDALQATNCPDVPHELAVRRSQHIYGT